MGVEMLSGLGEGWTIPRKAPGTPPGSTLRVTTDDVYAFRHFLSDPKTKIKFKDKKEEAAWPEKYQKIMTNDLYAAQQWEFFDKNQRKLLKFQFAPKRGIFKIADKYVKPLVKPLVSTVSNLVVPGSGSAVNTAVGAAQTGSLNPSDVASLLNQSGLPSEAAAYANNLLGGSGNLQEKLVSASKSTQALINKMGGDRKAAPTVAMLKKAQEAFTKAHETVKKTALKKPVVKLAPKAAAAAKSKPNQQAVQIASLQKQLLQLKKQQQTQANTLQPVAAPMTQVPVQQQPQYLPVQQQAPVYNITIPAYAAPPPGYQPQPSAYVPPQPVYREAAQPPLYPTEMPPQDLTTNPFPEDQMQQQDW